MFICSGVTGSRTSCEFPSVGTDPVPSLKSKKLPPLTSVGMQAGFHITSCPEKKKTTKLGKKMLKEFEEFRTLLHKRQSGTQD